MNYKLYVIIDCPYDVNRRRFDLSNISIAQIILFEQSVSFFIIFFLQPTIEVIKYDKMLNRKRVDEMRSSSWPVE